ncbi:hypothetical protein CP8484711_2345B, partial [Chlamydia psittaci 84-8471/1]
RSFEGKAFRQSQASK